MMAPDETEQRRSDLDEGSAEEPELIHGIFKKWQEVRSSQVLYCGPLPLVGPSVLGVVLGAIEDRIHVKFESRLDGQLGILNVMPSEIVPELPPEMGFTVGQEVAASADLFFGDRIGVRHGTRGMVKRLAEDPQRILVQFESRVDGSDAGVNVVPHEIAHLHVFGFRIADRVQASRDLFADARLLVREGARGVVMNRYSDTRLVVRFDEGAAGGGPTSLNVMPGEIRT